MSDALRAAFQAGLSPAPGPACPPPEELWALVRGELGPEERAARVKHSATCGPCAAALRIAVELNEPLQPPAVVRPPWAWRLPRLGLVAAAMAAALIGVVVPIVARRAAPEIHERGPVGSQMRSLVPPGPRPRSGLRLAWSAQAGALRYQVTLATPDLAVLFEKQGLSETQVLVPEKALAGLPPRARLVWRVEAVLADGQTMGSPAFELSLE